jgi:hypothetical protein
MTATEITEFLAATYPGFAGTFATYAAAADVATAITNALTDDPDFPIDATYHAVSNFLVADPA